MFKFRRPSICSDLEIVSDSDSVSDVTDEMQKGVSINSISESRASLGSVDSETKKQRNVNGEDCEAKSNESGRFHDLNEDGFKRSNTTGSSKDSGSSSTTRYANNPNLASEHHHICLFTTLTAPSNTTAMCDRKRKERHESCSQGQEKKVIRSLSHDDPKIDTGTDKGNDFRRTQSNDNFQPNVATLAHGTDESEDDLVADANKRNKQITNFNSKPLNSIGCGETKQHCNQNQAHRTCGNIDSSSYGMGSTTNPQYGIVRNMPIHFEAELQRQWERSAQWTSSSNNRKVHSGRSKHRSRSGKSSAISTPTRNHSSDGEVEVDDENYCEVIAGDNESGSNEEELNSPSSEESTSSSIDSLDDMENQETFCPNIDCEDEDIEADVESGLQITKRSMTTSGQNNASMGNRNGVERAPYLDFSTLHHQVETNEPISFLAALQTSGIEDQVMLSPRNSVLIKDTVDPSIPPSPPLYQAPLDPPVSRQHGVNHNIKMNQLSKQVSNMKRCLKSLEDEYEQHFGYKPSQADKLNQKEMRKCLLQLTKAKRELKQMKEDPASVRIGGNLLQVMNSPVGQQTPYARNSADALKNLDETVKEINKNMSDKRRATCRPEDPVLMTSAELTEEKNAMQKQLLMLEKRHGRPGSKEEKDIVRNLYDRYRSLKKTGMRMGNIKENSIDLAPILEYETLEFGANDTTSDNVIPNVEPGKDSSLSGTSNTTLNSPKGRRRRILLNDEDDEDDASLINIKNEGFTAMSLAELEARQKSVREEKRKLRTVLRKFETDFQTATGRPPQKDEKYSSVEMESFYQKYKRSRATVRLLDVLIAKRKFPQLLADINQSED